MTIDPAPETDARPASGGDGTPVDDTDVNEMVDHTAVDHTDAATAEQAAPFDAEAETAATAAAAATTLPPPPPPPAPPDTDEVAEPIVAESPAAPPTTPQVAVAPVAVAAATAAEAEPARAERRRRGRRIKARQVQRVITRVDPWSMLKVSLLFALSMWLIVVVAGVLIWRVAVSTGTISNFENFLAQTLGEDTFTIDGSQIFQGSIVVGLVFFVTGAVFAVVTSVLFNLIAGLVGGVRFTMVELETARPVEEPTTPS